MTPTQRKAPTPVTDEENEQFSQDVSNFKGADPEATMYALEQFLKRRNALAEPVPEPAEYVYIDHLGGTECVIRDPQLPRAAPVREPVPLLTDDEIKEQWVKVLGTLCGYVPFARNLEKAVRRKAGL